MDPEKEVDEVTAPQTSPRHSANCLSALFFVWMNEVLTRGSKRALQASDLFPLHEKDTADYLVAKISTEWREQREASEKKQRRPKIWKALMRVIPSKDYTKLVMLCFLSSASYVGLLLIVWFFLRSLMSATQNSVAVGLYIVGIGVLSAVRALCVHHSDYFCELWGMRLKVATIGLVYRKVCVLERGTQVLASWINSLNMSLVHNTLGFV